MLSFCGIDCFGKPDRLGHQNGITHSSARPRTVRSPGRRARSYSGIDGSASFVGDTLGRHQSP